MASVALVEPSPALPVRRGRPPKIPAAAAEAPNSPVSPLAAEAVGGYERERDARIRENMERMQKLGILDLAQSLSQSTAASGGSGSGSGRWRRKPVEPGSVSVARVKPASPSPARRSLSIFSVLSPLIYDQVRGQTCHQCRQKTLGHHTSCCKCQIVQGQFCGDCLYMMYGENVQEAKKNPNWMCPVCRGICNCSICRTKKGWFPTGCAYRKMAQMEVGIPSSHLGRLRPNLTWTEEKLYKWVREFSPPTWAIEIGTDDQDVDSKDVSFKQVVSLGYKSVAHYLIATKRSSADSEDSDSADSSNKLSSTKSETSCISDHVAPPTKEGLEDAETSSKAKQNKATYHQAKNSDGDKDDRISESVVTSHSQDDQANKDAGCATPSKPGPRKRKYVERSPDCVASRLWPQSNKP